MRSRSVPVPSASFEIRDLCSAPDAVAALLERWAAEQALTPPLEPDGFELLRLAVHEWVANLVQHASFPETGPLLRLELRPNGRGVCCTIEDNSAGFDLEGQLARQRARLAAAPRAERGRGLLILTACARDLCYAPVPAPPGGPARHRLTFWIPPRPDAWLDIPF